MAAAAAIALGGAGIVAGATRVQPTNALPELTAAADAQVAPGLAAADAALGLVAADVAALGEHGRAALAALVAADAPAVQREVAAGTSQLDVIDAAVEDLRAALGALPLGEPDAAARYSPATIARYDRLVSALPATEGLRARWAALATGAAPALQLTSHLMAHDRLAGDAVLAGSKGRYGDALDGIDAAEAELIAAHGIRDELAQRVVDVGTLDEWIVRNESIDSALRKLYTRLQASNGSVTPAVTQALAGVDAARASLPPDTRALVVILGDIARGGLNQSVIAIEQARGRLAAAAGTVE